MDSLFPLTLDTRVADTPCRTGFDTRPLLNHLGNDATWRDVLMKERHEIEALPGYGQKTADTIYRFINKNIPHTFMDLLDQPQTTYDHGTHHH